MSEDNNHKAAASLPDIQSTGDHRGIEIDQVGVSNVRYPLTLPLRDNGEFNTVASLSMTVGLSHAQKGTHMSRFMVALNEQAQHFRPDTVHLVLAELKRLLEAEEVFLDMEFPLFLERPAPVTATAGLLDYSCLFRAMMLDDGSFDKIVGVKVNVATCCPCSKEISAYGAHNQRSEVTIDVRPTEDEFIWFEDLIDIAERNASTPLYPILKREDEKRVTEQAYENPKFVEDIVRDMAIDLFELKDQGRIAWFYVSSNNYESIHNHDAFAKIERGVRGSLLSHRETVDAEALLR
jgi:GTP cyclohydrolase I